MFGFKMIGNWDVSMKKLKGLNEDMFKASLAGQRRAARKYKRTVKNHLIKQDLPWEPLQPKTIEDKGHDKILIDTRLYLQSITEFRKQYVYYVGIKSGTRYENGKDVARIARIHEVKSYRGGPYRALWNPSYEELGGAEGMKLIVQKTIEEKMKTRGWKLKRLF